jgi:glutamate--cysteine ligase
MRFMEAVLIYCLLEDSPPFDKRSYEEAAGNHTSTAKTGRNPSFELDRDGKPISLTDWASEILERVRTVAELIDQGEEHNVYVQAVDAQSNLIADAEATPSGRILAELKNEDASFFEFALNCASGHKQYLAELAPLPAERQQEFADEAADSLSRQQDIEAADSISLEEYLERWFGAD